MILPLVLEMMKPASRICPCSSLLKKNAPVSRNLKEVGVESPASSIVLNEPQAGGSVRNNEGNVDLIKHNSFA